MQLEVRQGNLGINIQVGTMELCLIAPAFPLESLVSITGLPPHLPQTFALAPVSLRNIVGNTIAAKMTIVTKKPVV